MNTYLKLSVLAAAAALISVSAQAQTAQIDNAQAEAYAIPLTPIVTKSSAPAATNGLTRAEVQAEMARARAAGEMDFAYAEVNGGALPQRGSVNASDLRLATKRSNVGK